jgi:hypothetical protein
LRPEGLGFGALDTGSFPARTPTLASHLRRALGGEDRRCSATGSTSYPTPSLRRTHRPVTPTTCPSCRPSPRSPNPRPALGFGWKRWHREWLYGTLGLYQEYRMAYQPRSEAAAPS